MIISIFAIPSYCTSNCFVPGECSGSPVTAVLMATVEECIWSCWRNPNYEWSSYDRNENTCYYYQKGECQNIDDSNCPLCLTNAKVCQEKSKSPEFSNVL